jgi:hypothetical protein
MVPTVTTKSADASTTNMCATSYTSCTLQNLLKDSFGDATAKLEAGF